MTDLKANIKRAVNLFKAKNLVPLVELKREGSLLSGKRVLVTGGSGGIGFAIASKMIESGAKVVIAGTNEAKLVSCCAKLGSHSAWITLDQGNVASFEEKINEAAEKMGGLDTLVCSAGIHANYLGLDFLNVSEEQYDSIMKVNLKGTYFISQGFARRLIKSEAGGHILLISSQSALEPAWSPYRLSKHGIAEITKGLAQRLIEHGIVVNGIGPGPTATSMQPYIEGGSIFTEGNPISRYTMPDEVAEYAVMLVSHLGDTVIGDTLYMSGGRGIIDIQ